MPQIREIRPQPGPQEAFLGTSADIAVFGGSAYGGKTFALLLECLRHVGNPGFGAVIFRRTSPQITNEGGLWDTAGKLFPLAGATPLVGSLDWRFPGGANVGMRHLQHEATKYDWQGTQVALLAFDELTHFTEGQFFYMMSRNRSQCGVRPYIRGTTNPDASSWVKRFLAPWVDRAYPDPAGSGEIRWFVRVRGALAWARSAEDLRARHPDLRPKSVTFIRSTIWDNRIGMEADPDYLANLQALPEVERARLLDGDWDVKREGLVYPAFGSIVVAPFALPDGRDVGGIDFGWNHPFAAYPSVLDRDDVLWVHWERYQSWCTLPLHAAALPPGVEWAADPARPDSIAELRIAGHDVFPCVHLGERPILSGIDQVSERIRTRRLRVSSECPELIRESGLYRYDAEKNLELPIDADNHAMDALRYLVTHVDRGRSIPPRRSATSDDDAAKLERVVRRMEARKRHERAKGPEEPRWWSDEERAEAEAPGPPPEAREEPWWLRHDEDDDD